MRAVVEHPWQAQWVLRQCEAYLTEQACPAPLPQVQTLGQWVSQAAQNAQSQSASAITEAMTEALTERQTALMLSGALTALNVDSIHSDGGRYALASEMVAVMAELDTRETLSKTLLFAGQDASQRLTQTTWLSREASWLSVARASVQAERKPTVWQIALDALSAIASDSQLVWVLPAPHPGLMMQAFLSRLNATNTGVAIGLTTLADGAAQTSGSLTNLQITRCEGFEHEAETAAQLVLQAMGHRPLELGTHVTPRQPQPVTIVAHDRVLARRVAALLARHGVAVEDRVGWALSTTVAATAVRGILSSWQGSDVQALMAWLALPVVARNWTGASATSAHLRRLWHAQSILPDGRGFISYAIKKTDNELVRDCLQQWQAAQNQFLKPKQAMTVGDYAKALLNYLAPLQAAMQLDAAGGKVWQQLSNLSLESQATPVTLATFIAVLDDALESERFSASSATHSDNTARAVFVPLYEAAWTDSASIIMIGCNESHLPAKPRSPTPLLASVRRELNLPTTSTERAVWQHLLASVAASNQTVYATYTPSEQGNPSRLSPWLLGCDEQTAANLSGEPKPLTDENRPENPPPTNESTAQLGVSKLPTEISVTKLAEIVQCPYRFALHSVFGIDALDEPSLWPSHLERGNLLHDALHAVQGDLHTLNKPAALHLAINDALHAVVQSKLPLSGRYAALLADSQRTVSTYIAAHAARQDEGWRLHATETEIDSLAMIEGVRVHGKLDRIDVIRDKTGQAQAYAVLDYKTSSIQTLQDKRDEPLHDAQLALYAALLEQQKDSDIPTAQAAYWRLHDGLYEGGTDKADYHSKYTVLEIADIPVQIDRVALAVRTAWHTAASCGTALATPSESACEYCAYKGVCRVSDLSGDGLGNLTAHDDDTTLGAQP